MRKKSSERNWETFPRDHKGIQVNACKSVGCKNFGVSPYAESLSSEQSATRSKYHPLYKTNGNGKNEAAIICKECQKAKESLSGTQASWMLKSNEAITQEFERLWRYLDKSITCPNKECQTSSSQNSSTIKKRGFTKKGTQRYFCKRCKTSFTTEHTKPHKRSEVNRRVFDLIVCKTPLRKIARHLNISTRTIYLKIDFIHKQCLKYAAYQEAKLLEQRIDLPEKIHLSTDRQVLVSNWNKQEDKRNVEIYGIGTACQKTGYVFGYHFNFDGSVSQEEIEQVAVAHNDEEKPKHHRKSARAWLSSEFELSIQESASRKKRKVQLSENESEIIEDAVLMVQLEVAKRMRLVIL